MNYAIVDSKKRGTFLGCGIILVLTAVAFLLPFGALAQKKRNRNRQQQEVVADTLGVYRQLMLASSYYRQLPVQGELQISARDNMSEDLGQFTQYVQFYLTSHGSYIRMGSMEQLAEDSLLVLVDNEEQQISLQRKVNSLSQQIDQLFQWQGSDSSLSKMAENFEAYSRPGMQEVDTIYLRSRNWSESNNLPLQEFWMLVQKSTGQPQEVITASRQYWPIEAAQYAELKQQEKWKNSLVKWEENEHFLVQERVVNYRFLRIQKGTNDPLPVRIKDRIALNGNGKWVPQSTLSNYELIEY